jgi:hypothetical protein
MFSALSIIYGKERPLHTFEQRASIAISRLGISEINPLPIDLYQAENAADLHRGKYHVHHLEIPCSRRSCQSSSTHPRRVYAIMLQNTNICSCPLPRKVTFHHSPGFQVRIFTQVYLSYPALHHHFHRDADKRGGISIDR